MPTGGEKTDLGPYASAAARERGWAQIATAALGYQVGDLFAVSEVPADTQV